MEMIEELISFGLTRQEASIYLALFTDGELTGYEAAKLTGISRSNTYNALAGLVEKGAAYVLEGTVTKYTAVPFMEFSNTIIRKLSDKQKYISSHIPKPRNEMDGYFTIRGQQHIIDKIITIVEETEQRLYISLPVNLLSIVDSKLSTLVSSGKMVVILTDKPYELSGAKIDLTKKEDCQIRLISDSQKVLTGRIDDTDEPTCLYS
ncbi:MAG: TrmB family transcriptional regulator, partial [Clostridiales bacterium]|nr:TrmB family transcriptional regulator [Clostridiales bacterium]